MRCLSSDVWRRVWSYCDTAASMAWACTHVGGKYDAAFFSRCILTRLVLAALAALRQRRECMQLDHDAIASVCMATGDIMTTVVRYGSDRVCVTVNCAGQAELVHMASGVHCAFGKRRLLPGITPHEFMFHVVSTTAHCLVRCSELGLCAQPDAFNALSHGISVSVRLHATACSPVIRAHAAVDADGQIECRTELQVQDWPAGRPSSRRRTK
jgi:hypothetical protein